MIYQVAILIAQIIVSVIYSIIEIKWGETLGKVLGFVISPLWVASTIFSTYVYFESSSAIVLWSSLMLLIISVSSTFSAVFVLKP